jgi:colanic acid/amylovoran biosynthesis glycosyltransferase
MRIGLVLPNVPTYSETFFNSKIKGLQHNGNEVLLFVQHPNLNFKLCPVYTSPKVFNNPLLQFLAMVWVILKLITKATVIVRFIKLEKSDNKSWIQIVKAVYLNAHILKHKLDWLHFGFGTMVLNRENVAKALNAKMAISFRGFDIGIYPIKNPNCYKNLWDKLDKIHVISNDIKELVKKEGFANNCPIEKITPAIDTTFFNNNNREFINDNTFTFITVARLHWKKGLVYTLEALSLLKKKGIAFQYTIIGDGTEMERLKFAAHQLGISESVTFTGVIPHFEVRNYLNNATIYIQYSIQEGFCNALLEAQALGLVCVASNAEGLAENIENGVSGFIVDKCCPEKLANKLIDVINLKNKEKCKISMNAQKRVKEHFNLEKQQQEFINFYSS